MMVMKTRHGCVSKPCFDGAEIEHVDTAGKEKQVKVTDSGTVML